MPLPFPEVHTRRKSRFTTDAPRKFCLNYIVLSLNWLAVREKSLAPPCIQLGQKLNRSQWDTVKRLGRLTADWNDAEAVDAQMMGRSAAKVESVEAQLNELESTLCKLEAASNRYKKPPSIPKTWESFQPSVGHPGEVVGVSSSSVEHLAKDLEADRLFFEGRPSLDPTPYLDSLNRQQYENHFHFAITLCWRKHGCLG